MLRPYAGPILQTAVSLAGISKRYDDRVVIDDLTLEVSAGEFLAIVGPSGSGKTTTMRIIAGFEAPDAGRVWIAGRDVSNVPPERRDVNTVFQSYALFPHMSVIDNVAFGPRMHGVPRGERLRRARELLDLVHLPEHADRLPGELSGGMQQRVALARALINRPAVLLLDEPLGALDRKLREELQRELRRIHQTLGATFVYVTHDQDEAFGMADRLAVMRDGRFEQIGTPASIYDTPSNAWVALFVGGANSFAATVGGPGARAIIGSSFGPLQTGHVAPDLRGGQAAIAIVRPEAVRIERPGTITAERVNRIPAQLLDMVAVGPSLRLRARATGGQEFEAIMRRSESAPIDLSPGEPVVVAFDAADTRVYEPTLT